MSRFNDDYTRTYANCSVFVHEPKNRIKPAGTRKTVKDVDEIDDELPSIRLNNSDNPDATPDEDTPAPKKRKVSSVDYGMEEKLIAAVWVHERPYTTHSMAQIKEDFHRRFDRDAPAKQTLYRWERLLFSTGSIKDLPRCPRASNSSQAATEGGGDDDGGDKDSDSDAPLCQQRKTKPKMRKRGKSNKNDTGGNVESERGARPASAAGSEDAA